ncbi:nitroreductase family protein [Sphingobacterium psychroaquaticum]|uniref:Putative NAD(P)H nitroreductase n=1 Tax=Sphingobacterium psychroaquaticum TaxID=561061 RepID=A0A1X7KY01_9SPHI|nr:nitroreductase [Sphingobacterium psychroaquaticum]QBQ39683.1 nitroreductase [Sphingobacterium psychroaquaticum]SMG46270.1 Nitroreductase [Sphingobacterium psychroaquaticum]
MSNEVLKAIQYRRTVNQNSFTDKEITKEDILTILEAANAAPTHKRTQPWRFVVFQKEGLVRLGAELSRIYKAVTPAEKYTEATEQNMGKKATQSNVAIAIVVNYTGELPEWEELAATACAVQNLWLAAHSIGLGGYWATPGLINHLGGFLNLEENQKCIGLFYLGHHESEPREPARSPIADKIRWEL